MILQSRVNKTISLIALLLLAGGAVFISRTVGGGQAWLYLTGGALGLVLFHASFGFTASWREFALEKRGRGIRAQMLMLAVASVIFLPVLDNGAFFGQPVTGAVAPLGWSVLVGAAVFGLGMQLGGACASGTLYTVGGGSARMVITLVFFMGGSLLGSAQLPWWLARPSLGTVSLTGLVGLTGALALQLGLFAAIGLYSVGAERRRHGQALSMFGTHPGSMSLPERLAHGPWPLAWGAVALALLNALVLWQAGHPWSISFGYTLWGGKAAAAAGIDIAATPFWNWPYPKRALEGSLFEETTSVMNMGIIVGAALAAGLAGKFGGPVRIPWRSALAAALGGLMMGYGARLAFGCNVGAYFSGIASGSAHGWLWLIAGFAGSRAGIMARPWFGLEGRTTAPRPAPCAAAPTAGHKYLSSSSGLHDRRVRQRAPDQEQ